MSYEPWEDEPLTLERPEVEPRPAPRPGRKALIIGGVAGACILGLGLGLLAQPKLGVDAPKPVPMAPRPQTQAGGQMDIVMAEPAPPPAAPKSEPLEVMSPEMARAAPKPAEPERLPVRDPPAPELDLDAIARDLKPARTVARPSFDCRRAGSYAEEMVCAEPALAAADRQLARAFQRALRAGAPYDMLRAEQDDWLEIREDAARHSPSAVAAVYDQRIAELNAMARGPGPDW